MSDTFLALDHIDLRNDWVLIVDADERVTPELAAEIRAGIACADQVSAERRNRIIAGVLRLHFLNALDRKSVV